MGANMQMHLDAAHSGKTPSTITLANHSAQSSDSRSVGAEPAAIINAIQRIRNKPVKNSASNNAVLSTQLRPERVKDINQITLSALRTEWEP